MLQRPHGLLHLFILLRFSPVLVSEFLCFCFSPLARFFPWSLRLPYWAVIFVSPFPFGLIFETFKNGRGRKLLQRVNDLISSCFSRRFLGGARFRFSCQKILSSGWSSLMIRWGIFLGTLNVFCFFGWMFDVV